MAAVPAAVPSAKRRPNNDRCKRTRSPEAAAKGALGAYPLPRLESAQPGDDTRPERLARNRIDLHRAGLSTRRASTIDDDREHGDRVAAGQIAHLDPRAEAADDDDIGG